MRVLVVDDHRNTRDSLAVGFSRLGHDADVAKDAEDAIERLKDDAYAWLVCDVRMPGITGVDVAELARRWHPQIRVVLMTACDVSQEERRIIDAIGGRLVTKPVTAAILAALCAGLVHSTLEEKEART